MPGQGYPITQARFRYGSQRSGTKLEGAIYCALYLAKCRRAHSALLLPDTPTRASYII